MGYDTLEGFLWIGHKIVLIFPKQQKNVYKNMLCVEMKEKKKMKTIIEWFQITGLFIF